MADIRQDLLRRLREVRRRIDPALLERTRLAALGKVPLDRDNADAAVRTFLETRNDGGAFKRKLTAALATAPGDEPPPPAKPVSKTGRKPGRLA